MTDQNITGTDLATIEKKALASLNKSAAKSDLDDLLMGARRSLLLVDTSSSMSAPLATGGRRIDALRVVVKSLCEAAPVPVAHFGREVAVCNSDIPEPSGMTPLTAAILFGLAQGATHLAVVTDGEPDNEVTALDAAKEFGNVIDVFYIGDKNGNGYAFAVELAKRTGGTCSLADLGAPKQLAGKIRLMLGDGN